jgi:predicted DNA-binding transcriptional regulator AlpA
MNAPAKPEALLRPDDVAEMLGVSRHSLYQWRLRGVGPKYVKLGVGTKRSPVRYRLRDVHEYLAECTRGTTSEAG